jgi:hypothetical protein
MELVWGVVQLRPEDAMVEAMLRGWRAQQAARGLRDDDTIAPRERLVRRFPAFTNEYPWAWSPGHMDEWSLHQCRPPPAERPSHVYTRAEFVTTVPSQCFRRCGSSAGGGHRTGPR